jgi:hypothetical protein
MSEIEYGSTKASPKTTRLTPIDRNKELAPLRRAYDLDRCLLYWIPVEGFPIPSQQRQWLMEFFDLLFAVLTKQMGLRLEVFLQYKSIMDLQRAFQETAMEFAPILGLSRRPGTILAPSPTMEDLAPVLQGKKDFDLKEWTPDYCYWFHHKLEKRQRDVFLGSGGLTIISLKPDPKTAPPQLPFSETFRKKHRIFQMIDVDAFVASACSLMDEFHPKSKELFASDLKQDPRYVGIPFVIPILSAADFFERPAEECEGWFKLFDVYISESPIDKGLLLASKLDLEEQLIVLLREMKEKGHKYLA